MYGNLPGLELCDREHVSWHMLSLGTEVDIHGVYFQGNTFQREGMTRDTLSLFPHTTVTVTMTPDNNGEPHCLWLERIGIYHIVNIIPILITAII